MLPGQGQPGLGRHWPAGIQCCLWDTPQRCWLGSGLRVTAPGGRVPHGELPDLHCSATFSKQTGFCSCCSRRYQQWPETLRIKSCFSPQPCHGHVLSFLECSSESLPTASSPFTGPPGSKPCPRRPPTPSHPRRASPAFAAPPPCHPCDPGWSFLLSGFQSVAWHPVHSTDEAVKAPRSPELGHR